MTKLSKELPGGNVTKFVAEAIPGFIPEVAAVVGQFSMTPPQNPTEPFGAKSMKEFLEKMQYQLKVPGQQSPILIRDVQHLQKNYLFKQVIAIRQDKLRQQALDKIKEAIATDPYLRKSLEQMFADSDLKKERIDQVRNLRSNYRDPEFM